MPNPPRGSRPLPSRRAIQWRSVTVLAGAVMLVAGVAIVALYRSAIRRAETDLQQLVAAQATLIERIYAGEAARTGDSTLARAHALSDFAVATMQFREFGRTGELVLAELRGDSVHFLLPERSNADAVPAPIALGEGTASQLQRAVRGETGVALGPDFRGVEVLGAYRFLPLLGVGLVAKIDVEELSAPFRRSALYAVGVALLVIIVGTQLHLMVVGPLIGQVVQRTEVLEGDLRVESANVERYATLFRSAADPIIVEDLAGRVIEANAAATTTFGLTATEMIGRGVESLFPDEDPKRLALLRNRAVHGEEVRDEERMARGLNGQSIHLLVSLTALRDEHGKVAAVSNIAKDITALRAAREALQAQNVGLEQQVQARTAALERELEIAKALAAETRRGHDVALLGESAVVRALREQIVAQSQHAAGVLLGGPVGAGQESVARTIHARSARATCPFLVLDCTRPLESVTPDGASPEAPSSLQALLRAAIGGTLYLELADMLSAEQQEELTPHLEGGAAQETHGVRIIAFVAGDIAAAMDAGRLQPVFGSTLGRHRLTVPPLAERRDDILPIAEHLLREKSRSHGKPLLAFTETAKRRLVEHEWPGNIRELSQVVESLVRESTGSSVDIAEPLGGRWRSVGGYRLLTPIGRGGMGEVWRAEHALLKRPAAVKLMRRHPDTAPADRAVLETRFRREAEVTATLNSPHTVQMFDYGVTDSGEFYYVMELLEGLPLSQLIALEGGLAPARAVYLLRQACLSLAEAHTRGLVHRDIKPDNLFVCRWIAEQDFLKVLDFGIVKRVEEPGTVATAAGLVIGTPSYMAPEVAKGSDATMAADLYSLGCVLYRMLTGRPVFDVQGGHMQQMVAHIEREPTPPSQVATRQIPAELDALVLRLLEKDPTRRPATALALYELLGELPLKDRWTDVEARLWWEARPHRSATAGS